jgi:hypothetical protein
VRYYRAATLRGLGTPAPEFAIEFGKRTKGLGLALVNRFPLIVAASMLDLRSCLVAGEAIACR